MQHSTTLLITQPGDVLGDCPVEKQIVPISANQMGLRISLQKHHHTTSSMLYGGNHTCGDNPSTYSASHEDAPVGTKNLKSGLIRPKDRFPPV